MPITHIPEVRLFPSAVVSEIVRKRYSKQTSPNPGYRGGILTKNTNANTPASPPHFDSADPVAFVRNHLHLDPDPRQTEVLLSTAKQGILNCTRQWGKSTIAAAKAIHRACSRPGSDILVASPSERQSALFVRKARQMAAHLGVRPRGDGDNANSLLFPNGSRIVGLPGTPDTVRGFSAVSLILIDEAAWVDEDLYTALRPMLAVGNGDLWLLSTPNGKQGFFYECWEFGGDAWFRISVPATECPRISADFLEKERNAMSADCFAQEFMAEFMQNGESLFSRQQIEDAIDDTFHAFPL